MRHRHPARDSPNGKRYARKDDDGEIAQAFGFDLMPLVARATEFAQIAEAVRAERRALKVARETLTLLRRDIVKLIAYGLEEAMPGDWLALEERYRSIMLALPRQAVRGTIEAVNAELVHLRADIDIILNSNQNSQNSSASESHSERHIQNSNPNLLSESEAVFRQDQKPAPSRKPDHVEEARTQGTGTQSPITREMIPLRMVIDACPNIVWVGKGGEIRSWADLMAATELVRPMLGISPSAWGEAIAVLGPDHSAATLAAIYQRADLIHSAGGYLRNLVTRARNGQFTVGRCSWRCYGRNWRGRHTRGEAETGVRSFERNRAANVKDQVQGAGTSLVRQMRAAPSSVTDGGIAAGEGLRNPIDAGRAS